MACRPDKQWLSLRRASWRSVPKDVQPAEPPRLVVFGFTLFGELVRTRLP